MSVPVPKFEESRRAARIAATKYGLQLADVDDIAQETWAKTTARIMADDHVATELRDDSKRAAYQVRVAINESMRRLARIARDGGRRADDQPYCDPDTSRTMELSTMVRAVEESLTANSPEALAFDVLCKRKSVETIAAERGISARTVRRHVAAGLHGLRQRFEIVLEV